MCTEDLHHAILHLTLWRLHPGCQVIENAVSAVKHLQSMGCHDIEFCAEDASRSDPEFLYQVNDVQHVD